MSLPRKHNLEQLRKLRKITKGQDIGDIVAKGEKKKEGNMPNAYWIDNPIDRNVDTYENFIKKDNKVQTKAIKESLNLEEDAFIIWENYLIQNEDFINDNSMDYEIIIDDIIKQNEYKEGIEEMRDLFNDIIQNHFDMELVEESVANKGKGPGNDSFFSNSFKQILTTQISPSILQIGKQVKVGKIEGIINSVDNEFVYITPLDGGEPEKISFKKFMKTLKESGVINEKSGLPSEYWMEYGEPLPMPEIEEDEEVIVEPLPPEEVQEEGEEVQIQREEETTQPEEDELEDFLDTKIRRIGKPRGPGGPPRRIRTRPDKSQSPREIPKYPTDPPRRGSVYGTEDDPMGLRHNENIYTNDFKGVKCDDCGQMVDDTYKAKIAHIYNKHFNKPEMDGQVPVKKYSYDTTWPQGGGEAQKLVWIYFPKN